MISGKARDGRSFSRSAQPGAPVADYAEIQRILIERGPIIIPYFFAAVAAYGDRFDGVDLKAFPGRTDFREVFEK